MPPNLGGEDSTAQIQGVGLKRRSRTSDFGWFTPGTPHLGREDLVSFKGTAHLEPLLSAGFGAQGPVFIFLNFYPF